MPSGGSRYQIALIWNGKEYPSIKSLADEVGVSPTNIRHKLINDRPLKGEYIDYKL